MTTTLQEMLRSGISTVELRDRYAIKTTRHREHQNLVLFKYDQLNSPFVERVVQESRGIILDEADDWRCVSRAFDKFFNHGEGHAAQVDWRTARVQEKVDGSLLVLYHYRDAWRVATTGTPDASGDVNGMGFTFADLFWRTLRATGPLPCASEADLCFAFEITSPWNRVVVRHAAESLTLLAVRDRTTGLEVPPEHFADRWPVVRSFPLQSMEDALATFETMDPLRQEGYVVVDGAFRRVKVKHPGYVAIHHMRDGFGPRRVLEVVRSGESPELLAHFPEWGPEFERVRGAYDTLCGEVEADFARLRSIPVQKDFALRAVPMRCSAALFSLRSGKAASVRAFFREMDVRRLMDLLGLHDAPPTES